MKEKMKKWRKGWQARWAKIDKKKLAFSAIAVLILLVLLFFLGKILFPKKKYNLDNLKSTSSFFLEDNSSKYALFNESGKQLTEFLYTSVGDFYGGSAVVLTSDGEYAIIKEDGKYLVKPTKDMITQYYGLYLISSKEDKIINYQGKEIAKGKNLLISSFEDASAYVLQTEKDAENKTLTLLDYQGKKMDTLPSASYVKVSGVVDGYIGVASNNHSYFYSLDSKKRVLETDGEYCLQEKNGDTMILTSCVPWYEEDQENRYQVASKEKILYSISKDQCTLSFLEDGSIVCLSKKDQLYYLVDSSGSLEREGKLSYQTKDTYLVDAKDHTVDFYVEGKKENSATCLNFKENRDQGYLFETYPYGECDENVGYVTYNLKGEKQSSYYYDYGTPSENGIVIAAPTQKNYYLMDLKEEKISESFESIKQVDNVYVAVRNNQYTLFDQEGNVLLSNASNYQRDDYHHLALKKDSKFIIYDSIKAKEIGEPAGNFISLMEHYFQIGNDYYSYQTALKFYTKK